MEQKFIVETVSGNFEIVVFPEGGFGINSLEKLTILDIKTNGNLAAVRSTKVEVKETNSEKTLGEKRVRTTFNPSDDSTVQHIKERAAEFINYVDDNVNKEVTPAYGEFARLKALALTSIEEAAMWAVKAATL